MIDSTTTKPEKTPKMETSKPSLKAFTPINDLIKDSWERVKRTWKQVILLYLSMVVFFGVMFGGFGAYLAVSGFSKSGSPEAMASMIASSVLIGVFLLIISVALSTVFQAATILAVSESKKFPTIGSKIQRGFQLFVPLFITSLIMMFLVFGGLGLMIIPGIAIAILTSYAIYEIVLTENKMVNAIRNSITIVQQNFGEIFSRLLVIFLISLGIEIVFGILRSAAGESSGAAQLISFLSMVVQPIYTLFSMAYVYQIYKEARKMTDFNRPASMIWMWIVAILGWVIGAFLIFSIAKYAAPAIEDVMKKEFNSSSSYTQDQSEMTNEEVGELDTDSFLDQYGDDMTEEQKAAFKESMERTQKMMMEDEQAAQNDSSI